MSQEDLKHRFKINAAMSRHDVAAELVEYLGHHRHDTMEDFRIASALRESGYRSLRYSDPKQMWNGEHTSDKAAYMLIGHVIDCLEAQLPVDEKTYKNLATYGAGPNARIV